MNIGDTMLQRSMEAQFASIGGHPYSPFNTLGALGSPSPLNALFNMKIKLTLSEIETLRAAAETDAKVGAVLKKFAPHIEIVVDFD